MTYRAPARRFIVATGLLLTVGLTHARSESGIVFRPDIGDAAAVALAERFDAVGQILPDGTGTLVAPRWVLTAAHVAASARNGGAVRFGERRYAIRAVHLHPQGTGPAGRPPEVDLGLIELEEPVASIQPVGLYRGTAEQDATVTIVGYGDFGPAGAPLTRSDGRRRAATNVIHDAGPVRLFMRFDEPPAGTPHEGVGGPGDSGGPALILDGEQVFVAGVSSGSMGGRPGQYGVVDVYARVSTQIEWIEQTMSRTVQ